MLNYNDVDDLTNLDNTIKLQIAEIEIEKIIHISNLLYDSLLRYKDDENSAKYLCALKIINKSTWNIRKMFPF